MVRTRTHNTNNRKSNKKTKKTRKNRKTRIRRQRGSGANCSSETENINVITPNQLRLNDDLGTTIVYAALAGEPNADPEHIRHAENAANTVKQLLDDGADANITIDDDYGSRFGMPVEIIPAIMYVARHMKGSNTIIMNHLLNADSNLNVQGGCAVSRMSTTLLSESAEWSNIDMVRELLKMGSDINDASHRPPALSYAVMNQDINMVKFIIDERKGQVKLGYTQDNERHNIIDEALENHENAEDEEERERTHEIVETLKRYAVKQSIMSEDDFNTKCDKNQETGKVECGILMDEITNKTAVMPHPPMPNTENTDGSSEANTTACFGRSALQEHLINRMENPRVRPPILTNPISGVEIPEEDIERMFPLGLDAHYTHESYTQYIDQDGGKSKRKTRKHKQSKKTKTKKRKQKAKRNRRTRKKK